MNTSETIDQLKQLKLIGMSKAYQDLLSLPVHEQLTLHQAVARLAEAELQHRSHRRTQMYLKLSKLRYNAVLENIQCSEQRNFTKDQLAYFVDGTFIERGENVLITGATGCGKSYLACALGRMSCETRLQGPLPGHDTVPGKNNSREARRKLPKAAESD